MDIQYIKDKLTSSEYDFLRTDPHLGTNILILTTAGSIAYGTNVDTSDIDVRGVTVEIQFSYKLPGVIRLKQIDILFHLFPDPLVCDTLKGN